jgi:hypothetical protein
MEVRSYGSAYLFSPAVFSSCQGVRLAQDDNTFDFCRGLVHHDNLFIPLCVVIGCQSVGSFL